MKKIVFWWNIPCAGMINVLKKYAEKIDSSAIVITGELSESRKAMGWEDGGKLFDNHIILSDKEWSFKGEAIIDQYNDRMHVFNGITYTPRMRHLIEYAIARNVAYCNMSEAYFNLEKGWKRILKTIFMATILPFKTRKIASNSHGVICLSGGSKRDASQFKRLGFKNFYPFGYFTDEPTEISLNNNLRCNKVHILCPGLLEHYKGVDILISALSILKKRGSNNYVCHITGNGSEKARLMKLVEELGLTQNVLFEGVLDSEAYRSLLSKIDILVAPGRVEPWGIRINEAIQRGNVVVVSDGIGAHCLVKESEGGNVFKAGNPSDLADKLIPFLISQDTLDTAKKKNLEYKSEISCRSQAIRLHEIISKL